MVVAGQSTKDADGHCYIQTSGISCRTIMLRISEELAWMGPMRAPEMKPTQPACCVAKNRLSTSNGSGILAFDFRCQPFSLDVLKISVKTGAARCGRHFRNKRAAPLHCHTIVTYEPWSILTIWLMVIPSIIRILIMVIINPYEPLDD